MNGKFLAGLAVLSGFAALPAKADFVDFCASPDAYYAGGTNNCAAAGGGPNIGFQADLLTGAYAEKLQFTTPTTFAATIVADWDAFSLNTSGLNGLQTGLNFVYNLYAVINASGTTDGNVFQPTAASVTLYIDTDINADFTFGTDTSLAAIQNNLTFATNGDVALFSATYDFGIGNISASEQQFDIGFKSVVLTAAGQNFFVAPNPFYVKAFSDGDIDGGTLVPVAGFPGLVSASGQLSANFNAVPEPISIALVGMALVGAGFAGRRRRV